MGVRHTHLFIFSITCENDIIYVYVYSIWRKACVDMRARAQTNHNRFAPAEIEFGHLKASPMIIWRIVLPAGCPFGRSHAITSNHTKQVVPTEKNTSKTPLPQNKKKIKLHYGMPLLTCIKASIPHWKKARRKKDGRFLADKQPIHIIHSTHWVESIGA